MSNIKNFKSRRFGKISRASVKTRANLVLHSSREIPAILVSKNSSSAEGDEGSTIHDVTSQSSTEDTDNNNGEQYSSTENSKDVSTTSHKIRPTTYNVTKPSSRISWLSQQDKSFTSIGPTQNGQTVNVEKGVSASERVVSENRLGEDTDKFQSSPPDTSKDYLRPDSSDDFVPEVFTSVDQHASQGETSRSDPTDLRPTRRNVTDTTAKRGSTNVTTNNTSLSHSQLAPKNKNVSKSMGRIRSASESEAHLGLQKEDTFTITDWLNIAGNSPSAELKRRKAMALANTNARHVLKNWNAHQVVHQSNEGHYNFRRHSLDKGNRVRRRAYIQNTGSEVTNDRGEKIYFHWQESEGSANQRLGRRSPRGPKAVSKLYHLKKNRFRHKQGSAVSSKSAPDKKVGGGGGERSSKKIGDKRSRTADVEDSDDHTYVSSSQSFCNATRIVKTVPNKSDMRERISLTIKEAFVDCDSKQKSDHDHGAKDLKCGSQTNTDSDKENTKLPNTQTNIQASKSHHKLGSSTETSKVVGPPHANSKGVQNTRKPAKSAFQTSHPVSGPASKKPHVPSRSNAVIVPSKSKVNLSLDKRVTKQEKSEMSINVKTITERILPGEGKDAIKHDIQSSSENSSMEKTKTRAVELKNVINSDSNSVSKGVTKNDDRSLDNSKKNASVNLVKCDRGVEMRTVRVVSKGGSRPSKDSENTVSKINTQQTISHTKEQSKSNNDALSKDSQTKSVHDAIKTGDNRTITRQNVPKHLWGPDRLTNSESIDEQITITASTTLKKTASETKQITSEKTKTANETKQITSEKTKTASETKQSTSETNKTERRSSDQTLRKLQRSQNVSTESDGVSGSVAISKAEDQMETENVSGKTQNSTVQKPTTDTRDSSDIPQKQKIKVPAVQISTTSKEKDLDRSSGPGQKVVEPVPKPETSSNHDGFPSDQKVQICHQQCVSIETDNTNRGLIGEDGAAGKSMKQTSISVIRPVQKANDESNNGDKAKSRVNALRESDMSFSGDDKGKSVESGKQNNQKFHTGGQLNAGQIRHKEIITSNQQTKQSKISKNQSFQTWSTVGKQGEMRGCDKGNHSVNKTSETEERLQSTCNDRPSVSSNIDVFKSGKNNTTSLFQQPQKVESKIMAVPDYTTMRVMVTNQSIDGNSNKTAVSRTEVISNSGTSKQGEDIKRGISGTSEQTKPLILGSQGNVEENKRVEKANKAKEIKEIVEKANKSKEIKERGGSDTFRLEASAFDSDGHNVTKMPREYTGGSIETDNVVDSQEERIKTAEWEDASDSARKSMNSLAIIHGVNKAARQLKRNASKSVEEEDGVPLSTKTRTGRDASDQTLHGDAYRTANLMQIDHADERLDNGGADFKCGENMVVAKENNGARSSEIGHSESNKLNKIQQQQHNQQKKVQHQPQRHEMKKDSQMKKHEEKKKTQSMVHKSENINMTGGISSQNITQDSEIKTVETKEKKQRVVANETMRSMSSQKEEASLTTEKHSEVTNTSNMSPRKQKLKKDLEKSNKTSNCSPRKEKTDNNTNKTSTCNTSPRKEKTEKNAEIATSGIIQKPVLFRPKTAGLQAYVRSDSEDLWSLYTGEEEDDNILFIEGEQDFFKVFGYDEDTVALLKATRIQPTPEAHVEPFSDRNTKKKLKDRDNAHGGKNNHKIRYLENQGKLKNDGVISEVIKPVSSFEGSSTGIGGKAILETEKHQTASKEAQKKLVLDKTNSLLSLKKETSIHRSTESDENKHVVESISNKNSNSVHTLAKKTDKVKNGMSRDAPQAMVIGGLSSRDPKTSKTQQMTISEKHGAKNVNVVFLNDRSEIKTNHDVKIVHSVNITGGSGFPKPISKFPQPPKLKDSKAANLATESNGQTASKSKNQTSLTTRRRRILSEASLESPKEALQLIHQNSDFAITTRVSEILGDHVQNESLLRKETGVGKMYRSYKSHQADASQKEFEKSLKVKGPRNKAMNGPLDPRYKDPNENSMTKKVHPPATNKNKDVLSQMKDSSPLSTYSAQAADRILSRISDTENTLNSRNSNNSTGDNNTTTAIVTTTNNNNNISSTTTGANHDTSITSKTSGNVPKPLYRPVASNRTAHAQHAEPLRPRKLKPIIHHPGIHNATQHLTSGSP